MKHSYSQHNLSLRTRRIKTAVIDITNSTETIFAGYNKTSQNEVRRASRDGVKYFSNVNPNLSDIEEFILAANDLALLRNVGVFKREFYLIYASRGELIITKTVAQSGEALSYHIWLRRNINAILINSVTIRAEKQLLADRNFAGRANRMNHWEDAKFLKSIGVSRLDLGGWQANEANEADTSVKGLRDFKSSLGARVTYAYYQLIPMSLIAKCIVYIRKLYP